MSSIFGVCALYEFGILRCIFITSLIGIGYIRYGYMVVCFFLSYRDDSVSRRMIKRLRWLYVSYRDDSILENDQTVNFISVGDYVASLKKNLRAICLTIDTLSMISETLELHNTIG